MRKLSHIWFEVQEVLFPFIEKGYNTFATQLNIEIEHYEILVKQYNKDRK